MKDPIKRFKAGEKVICILDIKTNLHEAARIFHVEYPRVGQVYVIRKVINYNTLKCPMCGLLLVGIHSLNQPNGDEQNFNSYFLNRWKKQKMKPQFLKENTVI